MPLERERIEPSEGRMSYFTDVTQTPILEQAARDTGVSFRIVTHPGRNKYYPGEGYRTLELDEAEVEVKGRAINMGAFRRRAGELQEMVDRCIGIRQQVAEAKAQQTRGSTS